MKTRALTKGTARPSGLRVITSASVSDRFRRILVLTLLSVLMGAHLVETSGRWDRTISDADDEAGVVAVVLCVGAALCAAGVLRARLRQSRAIFRIIRSRLLGTSSADVHLLRSILHSPPPSWGRK